MRLEEERREKIEREREKVRIIQGRVGRETPERNRCARRRGERDEPLRLLPVVRLDAT